MVNIVVTVSQLFCYQKENEGEKNGIYSNSENA